MFKSFIILATIASAAMAQLTQINNLEARARKPNVVFRCSKNSDCKNVQEPAHGSVICNQQSHHCELKCDKKYHLVDGSCIKKGLECTRDSQCESETRPKHSKADCRSNKCDFKCQAGYKRDGKSCVLLKECAVAKDCKDKPIPDNSKHTCDDDFKCGFECKSNFGLVSGQCIKRECTTSKQCKDNGPAHSHPICSSQGQCSYGCDKGFKKSAGQCAPTCNLSKCSGPYNGHGHATCSGTDCAIRCDIGFKLVSQFGVEICIRI